MRGGGVAVMARRRAPCSSHALAYDSDMAGAAEVLKKYDTDGNGRLGLKEFRPLVKELRAFNQQRG